MEGTKPTKNMNETLDEVLNEYYEACVDNESMENELGMVLRLIEARNNEFCGDGEDITDKLPTIDEALQLREENEKLKEDIDRRSQSAQEEVKRMVRLSGLGYDVNIHRNVNLDLMEKQIKENEKKLEEERDGFKLELCCVNSQMEEEEDRMKGAVIDENGELPPCDESCMGCRFARYRNFVGEMYDELKTETSMKEMYKAQIPDKKGKKLSRADKILLNQIEDDVSALELSAGDEGGDEIGGENYMFYLEKRALLQRLSK